MSRSAELRVAVVTDIHGNLAALEAVLADIDRRGPFDRLIAGGDHCLNGPDPADALDLVVERFDTLLRGNTDRDVLDHGASDPDLGEKKRASIAWTLAQLCPEQLHRLERLDFEARITAPDGHAIVVVHANPRDIDRHLFPDMPEEEARALVGDVKADMVVFGHLHIPFRRQIGALRIVNVASCGAPRDGDRRAVWGEIRWRADVGWRAYIHRVAYDYGATVLRILDSGMPHSGKRIRDLLRATYE